MIIFLVLMLASRHPKMLMQLMQLSVVSITFLVGNLLPASGGFDSKHWTGTLSAQSPSTATQPFGSAPGNQGLSGSRGNWITAPNRHDNMGNAGGMTTQALNTARNDRSGTANQSEKSGLGRRLREGSLIPETTGSIVRKGQRWMFIPDHVATVASQTTKVSESELLSQSKKMEGTAFGGGLLTRTTSLTYTQATEDRRTSEPDELGEVLVVENLMLQRIIEAIRENRDDDRWTITGQVNEFFDENRLILLTVKRATSTR